MVKKDVAEPGPHKERLGAGGTVFDDYNMWQHLDDARAWETTGPYPEIAAQLMRSKQVNLFMDQLIIKYPGATETTPWHQDKTYMGVDGPITVGEIPSYAFRQQAIELKDGSTRKGTSDLPIPDIEGNRDDYDIVSFDVEPGDAIVFFANICRAKAMPSTRRNRGSLSSRAIAATTQPT